MIYRNLYEYTAPETLLQTIRRGRRCVYLKQKTKHRSVQFQNKKCYCFLVQETKDSRRVAIVEVTYEKNAKHIFNNCG